MKRFAVLFGIIALTTVCATSFAEAPSIGDLPELRLVPTEGTVSPLLQTQLLDAYDAFDYIKDANDDAASLTVSITSVDPMAAPKAVSAATTATPTIEVTTGVVDVYGFAEPAWFSYIVDVADASGSVQDTAIAKYSTFAFDGPSIDTGRIIGDFASSSQVFTYAYSEGTLTIPSLSGNITPAAAASSIAWSAFVNSASATYDVNGNYLGLGKIYEGDADEGESVNVDDIIYTVNTDGSLTLTAGASIGAGPWVVGILATDDADDNNADGARVMVVRSNLASLPDTTYAESETFEGLALGTLGVQSPNLLMDSLGNTTFDADPAPTSLDLVISASSHWRYELLGTDAVLNSVPLEVVDIASDADLAAGEVAGVAEGKAIKATLSPAEALGPVDPNATYPRADGFRLIAGYFGPTEYGDVYTFSASVATNATDAISLPEYQMACGSGIGGMLCGGNYTMIDIALDFLGLTESVKFPLPTDTEGWMSVSVNFTPGATNAFLDVTGDGQMTQEDIDLIASILFEPFGATESKNEKDWFTASFLAWASTRASADVSLWVDNMRVYKSAYELDLALGPQELTTLAPDDDTYPAMALVDQTTGWDGSFDSYTDTGDLAADMSAVGMFASVPLNPYSKSYLLPPNHIFIPGAADIMQISAYDHTLNGSAAGKCLQMILDGDESGYSPPTYTAVQFQAFGGTLLADGSGLYAVEAYISTGGPYNQGGTTPRAPELRLLLNEVSPNPFGVAEGSLFVTGGFPETVTAEAPGNWHRVVATQYIEGAELVRVIFQLMDTQFEDVGLYDLPIYVDDIKIYKVSDNVDYFDAELFDAI